MWIETYWELLVSKLFIHWKPDQLDTGSVCELILYWPGICGVQRLNGYEKSQKCDRCLPWFLSCHTIDKNLKTLNEEQVKHLNSAIWELTAETLLQVNLSRKSKGGNSFALKLLPVVLSVICYCEICDGQILHQPPHIICIYNILKGVYLMLCPRLRLPWKTIFQKWLQRREWKGRTFGELCINSPQLINESWHWHFSHWSTVFLFTLHYCQSSGWVGGMSCSRTRPSNVS